MARGLVNPLWLEYLARRCYAYGSTAGLYYHYSCYYYFRSLHQHHVPFVRAYTTETDAVDSIPTAQRPVLQSDLTRGQSDRFHASVIWSRCLTVMFPPTYRRWLLEWMQ